MTRREWWRWFDVVAVVVGVGVLAVIGLYVVAVQVVEWARAAF